MNEKEFINKWKSELCNEGFKTFPNDFLKNERCREYDLKGKSLIIGEEFFGKYEDLDVEGKVFLQVNYYHQAKLLIYASRKKIQKVKMPESIFVIKKILGAYEQYLDSILKKIQSDYKKTFQSTAYLYPVTNEIFHSLNLTRY